MRKKNFKGRCEKRMIGKCVEVCRTYDAIQYAYADLLQASDEVVEIRCNVLLDGLEVGGYTSDFVCTKTGGDLMVRECVFRKFLMKPLTVKLLDADQRKTIYERYTMIAPILSFVADDKIRRQLIQSAAVEHCVSKQTVRNYPCLYLAYLDVSVLAPKGRQNNRELTQDEKNIRWALNKFFYTTAKQSLMTAYTMMLKEKYCDGLGGIG